MIFLKRGLRRTLLLAAGTSLATAAPAQEFEEPPSRPANLPPGAIVQPLDTGPAAELRRNLTALGQNPRSVSNLVSAGRAALEMGDPDAALTFFSRADELEARNPRVKAGMASAMAQLEQGQAALTLFAEAVQLGAPEAEIAGDRGLAYDTIGDTARAQRDYQLALRRRDDPEVRRRMALSLAISGDREGALRAIDGQLRRNDRAAWRAQAFILALTGDAAGAERTVQRVMPGAASAISPFLARLAGLDPSQKALAVHFGHFPGDGRVRMASNAAPAPGYVPPSPAPPAARARPDAAASSVPQRRQWPVSPVESAAVGGSGRSTLLQPRRPQPTPETRAPAPARADPAPPPAERRPVGRFQPNVPDSSSTSVPAAAFGAAPGFSLAPSRQAEASPRPVVSVPARPFSEIAEVVNALPAEERVAPPPQSGPALTDRQIADALARERERANRSVAPPMRTASASTPPATRNPAPAPARATRPANPSRNWVQIATVPDRAGLAGEFTRLRGRASEQLNGRMIYTAAYGRSSNRLLVGPFDTPRAAQEFVNQLGRSSISAFAWTSEAGQEIERVQTRR